MKPSINPRCGDVINTIGHYNLFKNPKSWLACRGIQLYQWAKGFKHWRATHSRLYIGELHGPYIEKARQDGLLECGAKRLGLTVQQYHMMLESRTDWCLSMTTPHGRWDSWEEIESEQDWSVHRPRFEDFKKEAVKLTLEQAAWSMILRPYDQGQLIDIPFNEIFNVPRNKFVSIFDGGRARTVCSGCVGICFEVVRKYVGEKWDALFRGLWPERYAPAHFESLPRGAKYHHPFRTIGRKKK